MAKTISIIGAGPVGSYVAYKLATYGFDVQIFEDHLCIGKPVQCTGIVTPSLMKLIEMSDAFVVNRMKKARIYSPNGKSIEVPLGDIIVDRTKFDQYLLNQAVQHGAQVYTEHRFMGFENRKVKIRHKGKIVEFPTDILIGADGAASTTYFLINKKKPRFYYGAQAVVKGTFEKELFEVYLGNVCPKFFGWVVPESSTHARIGLAPLEKPHQYFTQFLNQLGYAQKNIGEYQGGLIPIYDPDVVIEKDNVFLVGDAALQVKATTGGGIVPGMFCADILARCIRDGTSYTRAIKKIERDLKLHLFVRKTLDKFSDKDYNALIGMLTPDRVKNLFWKYDRDTPLQLLFHLALRQPLLARFAPKLFSSTLNFSI